MIEVNLLHGFSSDATTAGNVDGHTFTLDTGAQKVSYDKNDIIVKFVLLLVPLVLVYGYEAYDEERGRVKLEFVRNQVNQLTEELSQYGRQVQEVNRIQEEKKKLDGRIDTILELSSDRLTNAKAMNALHDLLPAEAWLISLRIRNNKVAFEGRATEDLVVSQFLRNLSESIYFKDIRLVSTSEQSSVEGVVKIFKIDAVLGGG